MATEIMLIMFIAGVFTLVFGKIHVAPRLYLYGRFARLYGLTLLIATLPVSIALSTVFFLALPAPLLSNQISFSVINLICTIAMIAALAYPFKAWQGTALESSDNGRALTKFLIFLGIVVITLVGIFVVSVARGVTTLGKAIEDSRKNRAAGEQFGVGKQVEDCIDRFLAEIPNEANLEAMVQVSSFNSGCISKSSNLAEWCRQFKNTNGQPVSTEATDAYCSKKNLHSYACTVAVTGAIRECESRKEEHPG